MKFDKVSLEHINKAIMDFNVNGIPDGFGASNYFDVEIDGSLYPPKVIMAYANFYATGEKPTNNFSGGRETPCFKAFKRLKIKIIPKANLEKIKSFIDLYKKLITNQLIDLEYNELYKWETFQHFQLNWTDNHNKNTILQNLKSSFYKENNNNLWSGSHYLPYKLIIDFASKYPENVSEMFRQLFDESKDLHERILYFETSAKEILEKVYPGKNYDHYQSVRAIMLYLSLRFPNKYYLYKNGMFNDFCKVSNFWEPYGLAKKQDYSIIDEFIAMCNEVKKELLKDNELIDLHRKRLSPSISFDDNNLLVQDFIYAVATYLNPNNNKSGEPINFILANITWNSKDWKEVSEDTSGHSWVSKENIPHESWNFDFDNYRNEDGKIFGFAQFTNPPKVEGSNNLIIFYSKGQIVGFYGKAQVLKELVNINDNESYNLIGDQEYSIVLETKIEDAKEKGYLEGHERVGRIGFNYIQNSSTVLNILQEALRLNPSQTEQIHKIIEWVETAPVTEKYIFEKAFNKEIKEQAMSFELNQILYGPPGTGKTYHTVLRAAQIIEYPKKIDSYQEALTIFKTNLHEQIQFITFHQNYSYEDFIQGLRPDTENDNQLTFHKKDGIFKVIADKALQNLKESEKPTAAKKTFEEVFNQFINPLVEGDLEEIEVKMKKVSYFITAVSERSIDFRKSSGGTAHTLSIGTLKKMYVAESVMDIQGLSPYYSPLLDTLLKMGRDSSGKKSEVKKKNYVIIIDEINRANISRVFGELITLIEPDKRSHGTIPMEAKLPSGDTFIVPSNLFIIGTMNTADKSIALLDIALRRRFEFEAMYPKYEIEGQEIYDVDILKKINEQIIKTKGHDFQIGHAYFMGENKDLVSRMNKKVIPLLLEYYMNDEKEVKGILQSAGLTVEENSWPLRIIGTND